MASSDAASKGKCDVNGRTTNRNWPETEIIIAGFGALKALVYDSHTNPTTESRVTVNLIASAGEQILFEECVMASNLDTSPTKRVFDNSSKKLR